MKVRRYATMARTQLTEERERQARRYIEERALDARRDMDWARKEVLMRDPDLAAALDPPKTRREARDHIMRRVEGFVYAEPRTFELPRDISKLLRRAIEETDPAIVALAGYAQPHTYSLSSEEAAQLVARVRAAGLSRVLSRAQERARLVPGQDLASALQVEAGEEIVRLAGERARRNGIALDVAQTEILSDPVNAGLRSLYERGTL